MDAPRTSLALLLAGVLGLGSACVAGTPSSGGGGGGGGGPIPDPPTLTGWTDLKAFLVASDGTRSLGDNTGSFNSSRDQGSKIVYFDPVHGDNATAGVYWWNGSNLVDADGNSANPENGEVYGTDPLSPNEAAIKPFKQAIGMARNGAGDPRLRTHNYPSHDATAGWYPDWFLFRRGQVHDTFDGDFNGGRSESAPAVIAAYGLLADGRAIMAPIVGQTVTYQGRQNTTGNPFSTNSSSPMWLHLVLAGLELRDGFSMVGSEDANSADATGADTGDPVTALIEDCAWIQHEKALGANVLYLPRKTTVYRSIIANAWADDGSHSLGYYTGGFRAQVTFEEVIFYRNGYMSDPLLTPDPVRDIFSRNIYEGGGAWMGHTFRNIISADGASGGPQMRLGGRCEDSLIVEGYWYSSTNSNAPTTTWLTSAAQRSGNPSAVVRNNVQLVFAYPSARDPDTVGLSDVRAQPGWGYQLDAASFGAVVEGNIISNAMLEDDLGSSGGAGGSYGLAIDPAPERYPDGLTHTELNNTLRDNIVYRTGTGLVLDGDWTGVAGNVVDGNVFASDAAIDSGGATSLSTAAQLTVRNNRFYAGGALPSASWMAGTGNTLHGLAAAAAAEGWPDPDRTLGRYVQEVLGLTLLDWSDDPYLTSTDAGTEYDPTGLKTFMAVATHMRRGGKDAIPAVGKPSWTGDYPWDERFTGKAVANWIRAGFGLAALP